MLTNTEITKTPIESAFTAANTFTSPCPVDGLSLYSPDYPNIDILVNIQSRAHDPKWNYYNIGYLPDGIGWVIWRPKHYYMRWTTIMRINPSKAMLTYPEFISWIERTLIRNRFMARADFKLDLYGWKVEDVNQHLLISRLKPRQCESTTYYGKNRRNRQVKVYDKTEERIEAGARGWDQQHKISRIEKTHSFDKPFRERMYKETGSSIDSRFSAENFQNLMTLIQPFRGMTFVDFSQIDGRKHLGRLLSQGVPYTDCVRILREKYGVAEEAKRKRHAEKHQLVDLDKMYYRQLDDWLNGRTPIPKHGPVPPTSPEEILEHMGELEQAGELTE